MVYFDQNREQLDMSLTLRRALAPDADSVIYRDRVIHVNSWARRFLFQNDQLDLSVSKLSGGERARVHIARLMLEPADVLLLDEPTNDLDIPTLEVLEESLWISRERSSWLLTTAICSTAFQRSSRGSTAKVGAAYSRTTRSGSSSRISETQRRKSRNEQQRMGRSPRLRRRSSLTLRAASGTRLRRVSKR